MVNEHVEAAKNIVVGVAGMSIGLSDITSVAQTIAAVGGAILVLVQIYKLIRKK